MKALTVRRAFKALLEKSIARSPLPALRRRAHRGDALILAYHNVVPDDLPREGDRSLHLRRTDFSRQLDHLTAHYDVMPLADLLGDSGRRRAAVAITFDDAYCGAVTLGIQELATRSLPATIFVAPGLLGDQSLWWDEIGSALPGGLPDSLRTDALEKARGDSAAVRLLAASRQLTLRPSSPEMRTATEDEVHTACRYAGLSLAVHSWTHSNLSRLTPAELDGETGPSLEWLRARFPSVLPYFSFPYGLHSRDARDAVDQAGMEFGFGITGGWFRGRPDGRFVVPRMNIPAGISAEGFALRVAGVL